MSARDMHVRGGIDPANAPKISGPHVLAVKMEITRPMSWNSIVRETEAEKLSLPDHTIRMLIRMVARFVVASIEWQGSARQSSSAHHGHAKHGDLPDSVCLCRSYNDRKRQVCLPIAWINLGATREPAQSCLDSRPM